MEKSLIKYEKLSHMIETQVIKDHMYFYGTDVDYTSLDKIFSLKKKCNFKSKKFKKHLQNISMYQDIDCYRKTSDQIYNFFNSIKKIQTKKYKIYLYKYILKILIFFKKIKKFYLFLG